MTTLDSYTVQDLYLYADALVREVLAEAVQRYYGTVMDMAQKLAEENAYAQTRVGSVPVGGPGAGVGQPAVFEKGG